MKLVATITQAGTRDGAVARAEDGTEYTISAATISSSSRLKGPTGKPLAGVDLIVGTEVTLDVWKRTRVERIEAVVFVLCVPAAFWLGESALAVAALIVSVLFLLIVEILNSAIEAVVDRIGPERHELSRIAKDLGSLAVLLATLAAGAIWLAALWDRFAG